MDDRARIHRFGDTGAVSINHKRTQYLKAKTLKALGMAMVALSKDIESEPFAESKFSTLRIRADGDSITIISGES